MNKKVIGVVIASISCVAMVSNLAMVSKANNVEKVEINNISSTELLEGILASEELDDVVFYNDQDNILKITEERIDEFKELTNRNDYVTTVIDYYDNYELAKEYATDTSVFEALDNKDNNVDNTLEKLIADENICENVDKDVEEASKVLFLEELMTSTEFLNKATSEEIEDIKEVSYEKYNEKVASELHKENADNIYERALEKETNSFYDVKVSSRVTRGNVRGNNGVEAKVKTPHGGTVKVTIYEYFGESRAKLMDMKTKRDFPEAEILAPSDNRYNCHSYAWHQSDTENRYWMNSPIVYLIDGSYEKTTDIAESNKVVWIEYQMKQISFVEHSGIVDSVSDENVVVISKWGEGPLVRHDVTYSPYRHKLEYYKQKLY